MDAMVTSVLQTTAGRMIFSEMKAPAPDKKPYPTSNPNVEEGPGHIPGLFFVVISALIRDIGTTPDTAS